MKTKVYNDIEESTFFIEVGNARLYFSSEFNLNRFERGYDKYIKEEVNKIKNKYHVNIMMNYYLLFAYYKRIEKRGFRIENSITGAKVNENMTFLVEL